MSRLGCFTARIGGFWSRLYRFEARLGYIRYSPVTEGKKMPTKTVKEVVMSIMTWLYVGLFIGS